jgi:hypothetical protein
MRFYALVALVSLTCFPASQSFGADLPPPPTIGAAPVLQKSPDPLLRPDSIFVFGGVLSTTGIGQTLLFNANSGPGIHYDNNIVGAAYARDWYNLGYGFVFGGEVGIADRFGHYAECCNAIVKSASVLNSGELWTGLRIRHQGFSINGVRVSAAATGGFSFTTNSIGRERDREIAYDGSGRILFYAGPELSLSLDSHPEWELVYRLQHRSGMNGTFGNFREGYNANVLGVRYKF